MRRVFKEPVEGVKNVLLIPATRWLSELGAELLSKGKKVRNISLFFEVNHTFNQSTPFTAYNTEGAIPGYALLNAGITANINHKNKTLFSIYLLGNNLSNEAYQNHLGRLIIYRGKSHDRAARRI